MEANLIAMLLSFLKLSIFDYQNLAPFEMSEWLLKAAIKNMKKFEINMLYTLYEKIIQISTP